MHNLYWIWPIFPPIVHQPFVSAELKAFIEPGWVQFQRATISSGSPFCVNPCHNESRRSFTCDSHIYTHITHVSQLPKQMVFPECVGCFILWFPVYMRFGLVHYLFSLAYSRASGGRLCSTHYEDLLENSGGCQWLLAVTPEKQLTDSWLDWLARHLDWFVIQSRVILLP